MVEENVEVTSHWIMRREHRRRIPAVVAVGQLGDRLKPSTERRRVDDEADASAGVEAGEEEAAEG